MKDHETLRAKAQAYAERTGISHYVYINIKTRKGKIFRHGKHVPNGWRCVVRAKPINPIKDNAIDSLCD